MWANNDGNVGAMMTIANDLAKHINAAEVAPFLHMDPRKLRKDTGPEHLLTLGRRFLALGDEVTNLERRHAALLAMHKARQP